VVPDVHRFDKKRQSWISKIASWRRKITDAYLNGCREGIKAGSRYWNKCEITEGRPSQKL
jgi:hypothetical protein